MTPSPLPADGLPFMNYLGPISSLLGSVMGAGPWGIAGLAGAGLALFFIWRTIVKAANSRIDARDRAAAERDAAETALELARQGRAVSGGLDALERANPPVAPRPPQG